MRCSGLVANNHTCGNPATHELDGYAGHDVVRLCDDCHAVVQAYEARKQQPLVAGTDAEQRDGHRFGRRLLDEGETVVALDEQGRLTEYRPDGAAVPYEDLDTLMGNLRSAVDVIREAQDDDDGR